MKMDLHKNHNLRMFTYNAKKWIFQSNYCKKNVCKHGPGVKELASEICYYRKSSAYKFVY